jgi:hypothetical protein
MRHPNLTCDVLQKTFIVATLASTLVGTFTASMGLWERVADRREQHRQKIRDTKQDDEIKKMKEQFEEVQKRADGRQQEIDRLKSGGGQGQGQIGWGGGGRDDVGNNFERDGMMIQRMYDQGYGRMGSRFAQGDGTLQSDFDARSILTDTSHRRKPTPSPNHLPPTNRYQRPPRRPLQRPPTDPCRHVETHRCLESSARRLSRCPATSTSKTGRLPGRFARRLTRTLPLPTALKTRSQRHNGHARPTLLPLRHGPPILPIQTSEDFWMIGKRTPATVLSASGFETDILETREFKLAQRFVIKCHTPDGEYACTICNRGRDVDAICRTVESLVKHVGTYHDVGELEREVDLRETKVDTRRLSLPAPRAPSPPVVVAREEILREYR